MVINDVDLNQEILNEEVNEIENYDITMKMKMNLMNYMENKIWIKEIEMEDGAEINCIFQCYQLKGKKELKMKEMEYDANINDVHPLGEIKSTSAPASINQAHAFSYPVQEAHIKGVNNLSSVEMALTDAPLD
ncbi:MAG: hypothetical protein EZS28_006429 [Streblomastix strix]|uniref:Uncharacterized protein n=1 Tax=Streblomastix strix TaxID=222440 RepID=A0A5J4WTC2_9EUKA|nr:MAG: hypothetical protein EZS28_006429 [Streblomastix strix]